MIKWFDYLWSNKNSMDEESVLNMLPEKLKVLTKSMFLKDVRKSLTYQQLYIFWVRKNVSTIRELFPISSHATSTFTLRILNTYIEYCAPGARMSRNKNFKSDILSHGK